MLEIRTKLRTPPMESLSDAISDVVNASIATPKDLAYHAGVTARFVGFLQNEERDANFSTVQRMSLGLISEKRCTRIAALMITPEYAIVRRKAGTANGIIDDEIVKIVQAASDLARAHQSHDHHWMDNALERLLQAVHDAKAERDRLVGMRAASGDGASVEVGR